MQEKHKKEMIDVIVVSVVVSFIVLVLVMIMSSIFTLWWRFMDF